MRVWTVPKGPYPSPHHTHRSDLLARDSREQGLVSLLPLLEIILGSSPGAGEAELGRNTLNTVGRVDVLDQSDLEAGSTTLAGHDGGVGKEELPDL